MASQIFVEDVLEQIGPNNDISGFKFQMLTFP